jgi:uncharacterized protein
MVPAVENNIDRIKDACKKHSVTSLYLFGSATGDYFNLESDIDFIVSYKRNEEGLPVADFDYFDLLFLLEEITGRKVDLVVADAIRNKYFKQKAEQQKQLIYAA